MTASLTAARATTSTAHNAKSRPRKRDAPESLPFCFSYVLIEEMTTRRMMMFFPFAVLLFVVRKNEPFCVCVDLYDSRNPRITLDLDEMNETDEPKITQPKIPRIKIQPAIPLLSFVSNDFFFDLWRFDGRRRRCISPTGRCDEIIDEPASIFFFDFRSASGGKDDTIELENKPVIWARSGRRV